MSHSEPIECELTVIGTGMAGMAAALFSANRGVSTVQIGSTGGIIFASGFFDLMGVHPVADKQIWQNPWSGIDAVVRDIPKHPYARVKKEDIRSAFEELLFFLQNAGLSYKRQPERNSEIITALGTIKQTYCVPETMWKGVELMGKKSPCVLIDIQGLKGFSARQIAATLHPVWPNLRTARVVFPGTEHMSEVFAERMAFDLELSQPREKFARLLQPLIKDVKAVGMPAILGLYRTGEVLSALQKRIGVPVFEIPTMPPSIPGFRLQHAFEQNLRAKGVQLFLQNQVKKAHPGPDGDFVLNVGNNQVEHTIRTKCVILASGRFLGKGLRAYRKRIRETIFDLPVHQPEDRKTWHRNDFLDPRGHPVNRAGLEIDDDFRPLDSSGRPAFQTLFAAGSILAHQDWMRMKCGSGLAVASAFGAVQSFIKHSSRLKRPQYSASCNSA